MKNKKCTNLFKKKVLGLALFFSIACHSLGFSQEMDFNSIVMEPAKEINPLHLVPRDSSIVINYYSLSELLKGMQDFVKKGFGSVGQMGLEKMKQTIQEDMGEDFFSPIGLYLTGIHPTKEGFLILSNSNTGGKRKKPDIAMLIPYHNINSINNFLYKIFAKSKKGGSLEIKKEADLTFVQAGRSFAYTFVGDYLLVSKNKRGLLRILANYRSGTNLTQQSHFKEMQKEVNKYSLRVYMEPKAMGSMIMDLTQAIIKKRGMGKGLINPMKQSGMELYEAMAYASNLNEKGLQIFSIAHLSQEAKELNLSNVYKGLSSLPGSNPAQFLKENPLLFVEVGLEGEELLTFLRKYIKKYDLIPEGKESMDDAFKKIQEMTGLDLEGNFIKNITSPQQINIGNISMPLNKENFLKSNSYLSFGYKDKTRLDQFLTDLAKFFDKKQAAPEKKDTVRKRKKESIKLSKVETTDKFTKWEIIIQENSLEKRNEEKNRIQIFLVNSTAQSGICYIAPEGFNLAKLQESKTEKIQGKDLAQEFSLGILHASEQEYGDAVALVYFDFKKLSEYMAEYKQNFILMQVKMILDNFDKMVNLSRMNEPWIRSWIEIRLK